MENNGVLNKICVLSLLFYGFYMDARLMWSMIISTVLSIMVMMIIVSNSINENDISKILEVTNDNDFNKKFNGVIFIAFCLFMVSTTILYRLFTK